MSFVSYLGLHNLLKRVSEYLTSSAWIKYYQALKLLLLIQDIPPRAQSTQIGRPKLAGKNTQMNVNTMYSIWLSTIFFSCKMEVFPPPKQPFLMAGYKTQIIILLLWYFLKQSQILLIWVYTSCWSRSAPIAYLFSYKMDFCPPKQPQKSGSILQYGSQLLGVF